MATITVNVSDEIAHTFRSNVYGLYGKKKGVLGQALNEAMQDWSNKKEHFDICMGLLSKGVNMGRITYKKRGELYGRN